jgi:hypothetical protein
VYLTAVGTLVYGSGTGLALATAFGVFAMLNGLREQSSHGQIAGSVLPALTWLPMFVILGALVGAPVGWLRTRSTMTITLIEVITWSWRRFWQKVGQCTAVGLGGWVTFKLADLATTTLARPPGVWLLTLTFFVPYCLVGGLVEAAAPNQAHTEDNRQRPRVKHAALGVTLGLVIAVVASAVEAPLDLLESHALTPSAASIVSGLAASVISGLLVGLIVGLAGGWSGRQLLTEHLLRPGQGIWRAAQNGISIGLCGGVVTGVWVGVIYAALIGLKYGQYFGLVAGATVALGVGFGVGTVLALMNGGSAFIKHFVLRFLLWRNDYMPWRYATFLDYSSERAFVRKVRGGYMFVHVLLRDHFAHHPRGLQH